MALAVTIGNGNLLVGLDRRGQVRMLQGLALVAVPRGPADRQAEPPYPA